MIKKAIFFVNKVLTRLSMFYNPQAYCSYIKVKNGMEEVKDMCNWHQSETWTICLQYMNSSLHHIKSNETKMIDDVTFKLC